jgi:hypothetical protein
LRSPCLLWRLNLYLYILKIGFLFGLSMNVFVTCIVALPHVSIWYICGLSLQFSYGSACFHAIKKLIVMSLFYFFRGCPTRKHVDKCLEHLTMLIVINEGKQSDPKLPTQFTCFIGWKLVILLVCSLNCVA